MTDKEKVIKGLELCEFNADLPRQCKAYRLSEHYKKGGKFYESRLREKGGD